jgi:hypothetical protein
MTYTCVIIVWQHCARMPQSCTRSTNVLVPNFLVFKHEFQRSNVHSFDRLWSGNIKLSNNMPEGKQRQPPSFVDVAIRRRVAQ